MADQKAILKAGGKEIELPILSGTEGQDVIDVRTLGQHGYFTYVRPRFYGDRILRVFNYLH